MVDWNNIKTVFLDMDGTLLDLHYDNYFWLQHLPLRYAQIKELPVDQAQQTLTAMYETLQGSLNWYCLDFWADSLAIDLLALKHEIAGRIAYRPNAKAFLQALKSKDYEVVLVTNAHRDSIDIKFEYTDLRQHLGHVICSHDLNLPKEDPRFWSELAEIQAYDCHSTVFFDDNEAVLASARQAGLKHLVSIAQPDSQQRPREQGDFPLLVDFADLTP